VPEDGRYCERRMGYFILFLNGQWMNSRKP
jgi:hypothetical protein